MIMTLNPRETRNVGTWLVQIEKADDRNKNGSKTKPTTTFCSIPSEGTAAAAGTILCRCKL